MGISDLMDKLHHKHEDAASEPNKHEQKPAIHVPKPPQHQVVIEHVDHEPLPKEPVRRKWGAVHTKEVNEMGFNEDGVIVDIGEEMSVNLPIKKRMSLQEFLKIAERVKHMEELLATAPDQDAPMTEYQ